LYFFGVDILQRYQFPWVGTTFVFFSFLHFVAGGDEQEALGFSSTPRSRKGGGGPALFGSSDCRLPPPSLGLSWALEAEQCLPGSAVRRPGKSSNEPDTWSISRTTILIKKKKKN